MTAEQLIYKITDYSNKIFILGDNCARKTLGNSYITDEYIEGKRKQISLLGKEIEQDIRDVFNTKTSCSIDKASLWDKILAYAHARVAVMISDEAEYQQCDNNVKQTLEDMKKELYAEERASAASKLSEAERRAVGL